MRRLLAESGITPGMRFWTSGAVRETSSFARDGLRGLHGPDREAQEWVAGGMLPLALLHGAATAEEIGIDTLTDRLEAETVGHGLLIKSPDLITAWARRT